MCEFTILSLITNYTCNLLCPYCYNPPGKTTVMSSTVVETLAEQLDDIPLTTIDVQGGEPLLHKRLVKDIFAVSEQRGIKIRLSTNGRLLPQWDCKAFEGVLQLFHFSIHPWEFNKMSDIFSFVDSVFKKIEKIYACNDGLTVYVNVMLYKKGYKKLKETVEYLFGNDSSFPYVLQINAPYLVGSAAQNAIVPGLDEINNMKTLINHLQNVSAPISIETNLLPTYFKPYQNNWGYIGVVLTPDGYVLPFDLTSPSLMGILDFPSIKTGIMDIWFNHELLTTFRTFDWLPNICAECDINQVCRGGGRTNALLFNGDLFAEDPYCPKSCTHYKVLNHFSKTQGVQ